MANECSNFIKNNEEIILDTSAAMHYKGFSIFVKEHEKELEYTGKKIQVVKAVWLELIRNYNSHDKEKEDAASHAISIISSHRNIFEIEDEEVFQYKMEHAFADKDILSKLTLDKTESRILLITNDRMLSKDALEINKQSSCKGFEISTCFVADNGMLFPGFASERRGRMQKEPIVQIKEVVKIKEVPQKESNFKISQIILPITTFATGAVLGKYGNTVFKYIKKVA